MYTKQQYLEQMKKRLSNNFELFDNQKLSDIEFELFANYKEVSGRTLISKVDVIDKLEKRERLYFKHCEKVDASFLEKLKDVFVSLSGQLEPDTIEHMSTAITVVVYSENVDQSCFDFLKKFKYTKYYQFALKGWCDVRFVVVDLNSEKITTCRKAKPFSDVYDINAKKISSQKSVFRGFGKILR